MAWGLTFEVELGGGWENLEPAAAEAAVRTAMLRWGELVAATARRLAPKDTGVLAGSLMVSALGTAVEMTGTVVSPLAYAPTMEFGRRPGSKPPPKGALRGWMDRHPAPAWVLERYPTDEAREDALRFSIAARGIVPHPFLRPAFDATASLLPKFIERELLTQVRPGTWGSININTRLT